MFWKEIDGGSNADAVGFKDVNLVASVMLHNWHDVKSNGSVVSK